MKRLLGAGLVGTLIAGLMPAVALAATGPRFDEDPGGRAAGVVWSHQPCVAIKTGNNFDESATGSIMITVVTGTAGSRGSSHLTDDLCLTK